MAKLAVFFGLLLTVIYASAKDDFLPNWVDRATVDELKQVKQEIEREIGKNKLTCENYEETYCLKNGGGKVCEIWFGGYLCEELQSLEGIRQIMKNIDTYIKKEIEDNLVKQNDKISKSHHDLFIRY